MSTGTDSRILSARIYSHPWRVPVGYSALDSVLGWVLVFLAFTLPLEGIFARLGFQGSRTPPFYITSLAIAIAGLRLPFILRGFKQNTGLVFITLAFAWSHLLYYFDPKVPLNSLLIPQLIIMATIFTLMAGFSTWRSRFLWAFYVGWLLLVLLSIQDYMNGNVSVEMSLNKEFIRVKNIVGWTAAQHATMMGAGLIVGIGLFYQTTRLFLRGILLVTIAVGSFGILISNTRAPTIAVLLTAVLWSRIQLRHSGKQFDRRIGSVLNMIVIGIVIYIGLSTTALGEQLFSQHLARFEETLTEQDFSHRDELTRIGLEIALENPIGIGQNNSIFAISVVTGIWGLDVHNYYIRMMIDSGLPGFALFCAGLWLALKNGWIWYRLYPKADYLFPFIYLLIVAASAQGFHYKITWFFLAMNLVTPLVLKPAREREPAPLPTAVR